MIKKFLNVVDGIKTVSGALLTVAGVLMNLHEATRDNAATVITAGATLTAIGGADKIRKRRARKKAE